MTAAIETVGLSKRYGSTRALAGLDLRVEQGQCFGFLGPNGAGKTTTIRLLLALQRPTSGAAVVLGQDVQQGAPDVHRRVGYLPADMALYPHMTGQQHIDWFARARGNSRKLQTRALAERFQVVLDRPTRELSTGNRQKIGLVLAFMHCPELLILDEPTAGLDPLLQAEFERLIRETVADGRTVFLSSHELDEVQRLADRVAIIRSGQLVASDTVDHLRASVPQKVEVRFSKCIDPAVFSHLDAVTVVSCDGSRVVLEVAGQIGPVLRVISEHDPVDLVSRHADLDELFLNFYREPSPAETSDAN